MDLHQGQIQGFFNIPVDELTAVHLLSNYFGTQADLDDLGRRDRPRLRQARAQVRRAARRAARHHREAAHRQPRPGRAASTSSARCADAGRSSSTTRSIRRHDDRDRPRPGARGRHRDLCLRHPRRPVGSGDRPHPASRACARSSSPTRSRCRRPSASTRSRRSRSRRSSARPSSASTAANPSAPSSAARSSFTQEMLLWEDGVARRWTPARRTATRNRTRRPAAAPTHPRPRSRPTRRRASPVHVGRIDEPAAAPARRPGRHRTANGRGPGTGAISFAPARWGAVPPRRPLPELRNPEMNPTSSARSVALLGRARRRSRSCSSSLATAPASGTDPPGRLGPARPREAAPLYSRFHAWLPEPIRRLERARNPPHLNPSSIRSTPSSRSSRPLRRRDPRANRRDSAPRSRGGRARRAVRGRAPPSRISSADARSPRRATSARRAAAGGPRRRAARGLRRRPARR